MGFQNLRPQYLYLRSTESFQFCFGILKIWITRDRIKKANSHLAAVLGSNVWAELSVAVRVDKFCMLNFRSRVQTVRWLIGEQARNLILTRRYQAPICSLWVLNQLY